MDRMSRTLFVMTLMTAALAPLARPAAAQPAEHDAIKAVVRTETESFFKRDADTWKSTWQHDADVTRTMVSGTYHTSVIGWENFGPNVIEFMKKSPKPISITFANDNFIIRVGENVAWVEFDQTMSSTRDPGRKRHSRERRALEKKDGRWKIVAQITIDPETFGSSPSAIEGRLNTDGYSLLKAGKAEEAIELFLVNVRLNPDSWNAHDSLGEAYAAAGKKELAIEHYEKSLKLNPKNENGKAALAKLKQQ
jgi:hypothetical protein